MVLDRKLLPKANDHHSGLRRNKHAAATPRAAADSAGFMKPMLWMFEFALGRCHHSQMSRVFTLKNRTYKVCFECGKEFEYSWTGMHSLQSNAAGHAYALLNGVKPAEVPGA